MAHHQRTHYGGRSGIVLRGEVCAARGETPRERRSETVRDGMVNEVQRVIESSERREPSR